MVKQLKIKAITTFLLIIVVAAFLFLAACKDRSVDDGLEDADDNDDEVVPNDVTVDVSDGDTSDVEETASAEDGSSDVDDETEEVVEERLPLTSKDSAASKISKLDDPLDEVEDILEDFADEVERGTAKFSQIKFEQLNVALTKDLKKLNSDISMLTSALYDGDSPDFAMITEEYYRIIDAVKVFYEQASKDLDDLQGTQPSSSSASSTSTSTTPASTTEPTEDAASTVELSNDCADPDGLNFNVKGTTSGIYYTGAQIPQLFEDKCAGLNDEKAYDYYCENNRVRFQLMTCTNGCQDGKCS